MVGMKAVLLVVKTAEKKAAYLVEKWVDHSVDATVVMLGNLRAVLKAALSAV